MKPLPSIPPSPTLALLQQYQEDMCKARGWDDISDLGTFLLFTEEVGELAKAIRNQRKISVEVGKSFDEDELAKEFADVFSYLLDLANRFDIDLEEAYRKKEAENSGREWQ